MQLPIVLIGPMCSGKTTLAEALSKKLNIPHYPIDFMRGYYYLKAGIDLELAEKYRKEDFLKYAEYTRPYELDAIEKALQELEFQNGIIHFGAGHSYYEDSNMLDRAKAALKNTANVILILPSKDTSENSAILQERLREREGNLVSPQKLEKMLMLNEKFITAKSNLELAKLIIYTENKTTEETLNKIIELSK